MWKDFGIKCVNWSTFCILDEYPRAGVDALKLKISLEGPDKISNSALWKILSVIGGFPIL